MNTLQTGTIQNIHKSEKILSNQLPECPMHLYKLPPQKTSDIPTASLIKKLRVRRRLIKRASPFLLTALFLPVLFTYWFIAEGETINKWLMCSTFVFLEVNLFYLDIVLWKYYQGKKIFRIWLIELSFVFVATIFYLNIFSADHYSIVLPLSMYKKHQLILKTYNSLQLIL